MNKTGIFTSKKQKVIEVIVEVIKDLKSQPDSIFKNINIEDFEQKLKNFYANHYVIDVDWNNFRIQCEILLRIKTKEIRYLVSELDCIDWVSVFFNKEKPLFRFLKNLNKYQAFITSLIPSLVAILIAIFKK